MNKIKSNSNLTPSKKALKTTKTLLISRGIWSLYKVLKENLKDNKTLDKLFFAGERLAAINFIINHEINGLIAVIYVEKKKRNKGQRLNLLKEGASGPQLFSLNQEIKAKSRLFEKEEKKRQKRRRKELLQ